MVKRASCYSCEGGGREDEEVDEDPNHGFFQRDGQATQKFFRKSAIICLTREDCPSRSEKRLDGSSLDIFDKRADHCFSVSAM